MKLKKKDLTIFVIGLCVYFLGLSLEARDMSASKSQYQQAEVVNEVNEEGIVSQDKNPLYQGANRYNRGQLTYNKVLLQDGLITHLYEITCLEDVIDARYVNFCESYPLIYSEKD